MSDGGWLVLGSCVLVVCVGLVVWVFDMASDWAIRRQDARDAAATFVDAYLPEAEDVATAEAELPSLHDIRDEAMRIVLEAEMVDMLDEAIAHIEGGWTS
jgi:hypothetical protein